MGAKAWVVGAERTARPETRTRQEGQSLFKYRQTPTPGRPVHHFEIDFPVYKSESFIP